MSIISVIYRVINLEGTVMIERRLTNFLLLVVVILGVFFILSDKQKTDNLQGMIVQIKEKFSPPEENTPKVTSPVKTQVFSQEEAVEQQAISPSHRYLRESTIFYPGRYTVVVSKGLFEIVPDAWEILLDGITPEYREKFAARKVTVEYTTETNRVGVKWVEDSSGTYMRIGVHPDFVYHPTCLEFLVAEKVIHFWETGGAYSEEGPAVNAARFLIKNRVFKGIDYGTVQIGQKVAVQAKGGDIGRGEAFMWNAYYDSYELHYFIPAGRYEGYLIPGWKVDSEKPQVDWFVFTKAQVHRNVERDVFIWEGYLQ